MNLQLRELLPFLIPLIIVQLILYAVALVHVITHSGYKRGNRLLWLVVITVGINFVGPILYFLLGKEEE